MQGSRNKKPGHSGPGAENLALEHLQKAGLSLVTRNYVCRLGEIDLVLTDGSTLVMVEVRYRAGNMERALYSVDRNKRNRIRNATRQFIERHREFSDSPVRFDVVGIGGPIESPEINWIENAFEDE